jgi:hypothetical protein
LAVEEEAYGLMTAEDDGTEGLDEEGVAPTFAFTEENLGAIGL